MTKVLEAPDYFANEYAPAHRSNYTAGRLGESIDKIVVHVTQGSFASAYNWCQRSEADVSWHYLIAQSGHAAQQLSEKFMGWHAGNLQFNKTSVGIEHSGYISDRSMWTEAMYRNSAKIAAGIIHRAPGIPNDRFGYHLWAHSSIPGSTHTDPGRYFNWDKYMALIEEFLGGSKADNPPVQSGIVYRVIAGSFSHRSNANDRARQLVSKGFPEPWIYQHDNRYYRVQVGSFDDQHHADELVHRIKVAGFEAIALAEEV